MTNREMMFEPVLKADPSFKPIWDAFVAKWNGEGELPLYIAAAALARHLVSKIALDDTAVFPAIFAAVDGWLVEKDRYVRGVAAIGFLEDLQDPKILRGTHPAEFKKWLGPEAQRAWENIGKPWPERVSSAG